MRGGAQLAGRRPLDGRVRHQRWLAVILWRTSQMAR